MRCLLQFITLFVSSAPFQVACWYNSAIVLQVSENHIINLGFRCICEFGFLGFALGIQIPIYILYLGYSHQRWLKPFLGSTFVNTTVKNLLIWYSLSQYLLLGGLFIALCKCHNLSSVTCLQPQFLTKNLCMRTPDLVTECCNTFSRV